MQGDVCLRIILPYSEQSPCFRNLYMPLWPTDLWLKSAFESLSQQKHSRLNINKHFLLRV